MPALADLWTLPGLALCVMAATCLALAVATFMGSRRRGSRIPHAVLVGLCFPVSWVAWYVVDRRAAGAQAGGPRAQQ